MYSLATSDGTYFANGFLVSNCDCIRYLALFNPKYVSPMVGETRVSPAVRAYRSVMEMAARREGSAGIRLGPGATQPLRW